MAILVTGGTGYIGSHTTVELLNIGEEVIIVDNLCNSKTCVLDRVEKITGKRPTFIKCDLLDKEALERQLKERGCEERRSLAYHKALLNGDLPYTIGGGIGQSRMCMYFLRKAHIGEVHSSYWDEKTQEECLKKGVHLL